MSLSYAGKEKLWDINGAPLLCNTTLQNLEVYMAEYFFFQFLNYIDF